MELADVFNYLQDPDNLIRVFLFVTVIMYNFYALAIAFQILTYNRILTISTFAPLFRAIAILHVALSFILLLIVIFSL